MRGAEPGEAGVVGLGKTHLQRARGGGWSAGPGKQPVYQLGGGGVGRHLFLVGCGIFGVLLKMEEKKIF